jgi:GNAT superfamily N-acetyltransferase
VTTEKQRRQFLELPWKIYQKEPNWMPPLRGNQRALVGYPRRWFGRNTRHPFYRTAESQTFLAYRDGQPCGRIAAIINRTHDDWYKNRQGFFGFFETLDDPAVARGLFDAARDWLAGHDIVSLRGPVNPSLNYECGLLIEGFDTPPFFMMTYNPPYYSRLIESYGFQKAHDLYAFWGHIDMLASLDEKLAFISQAAAERFHIQVRQIDKRHFRSDVELFLDIYNQSLVGTWGYVPLSRAEIREIAGALRHLIVPELTVFAEVEGKAIGSAFGLLDYNPRIRQIDGKLFPFGFLRLIRNRRAIKRIRLVSTNVVPAYQRWGIGLVMLSSLAPRALAWGIEEAEFSWVLESNALSRGTLEKGGAKRTKTYRIYDFPPRR